MTEIFQEIYSGKNTDIQHERINKKGRKRETAMEINLLKASLELWLIKSVEFYA